MLSSQVSSTVTFLQISAINSWQSTNRTRQILTAKYTVGDDLSSLLSWVFTALFFIVHLTAVTDVHRTASIIANGTLLHCPFFISDSLLTVRDIILRDDLKGVKLL